MIEIKEFKHRSSYKGIDVYVEDFKPNSKAAWVIDGKHHYGYVAEYVKYINKPTSGEADEINCIENYGYDLTTEFVEDNACYIVALNEKLNWLVHVCVSFDEGLGGQYDERIFHYYGAEDELREYAGQFGVEKWKVTSGKEIFTKTRTIYYEPYTPPEFLDELPEEYLRKNRQDWVSNGNFYVEKDKLDFHALKVEELPF